MCLWVYVYICITTNKTTQLSFLSVFLCVSLRTTEKKLDLPITSVYIAYMSPYTPSNEQCYKHLSIPTLLLLSVIIHTLSKTKEKRKREKRKEKSRRTLVVALFLYLASPFNVRGNIPKCLTY